MLRRPDGFVNSPPLVRFERAPNEEKTIYRVLTFMALGVVLLVLGFIYNKYQEKIRQWLWPPAARDGRRPAGNCEPRSTG